MCGIAGVASLSGAEHSHAAAIRRMTRSIRHRGPDDEGFYEGQGVVLGMRRLSIIDLEGGHQPLSNTDETLWLVCNGEIYNYRELRADLIEKGHHFKTQSDCEVLIHLYTELGDDFVSQLNGMYGFALWDAFRRRLLLGRDHLGVKPLYYCIYNGSLIFASELKAILEIPGLSASIDPAALEAYLTLGYVPAPLTLLQGIRKVAPGSMLIVEDGQISIRRYWALSNAIDESRDEEEWADAIRAQLDRSVAAQMVSDVPIGAFLSGGIDSSAVVAFMSRHSARPVKTYSIGFEGGPAEAFYNELPYARRVAERFGTEHREIIVRPDVVQLLPRLIWHLDEPIADSALVTTHLVSEFARRDVKVILSGVGGDELFGGYRRYLGPHYDRYYRALPFWLRRHVLQRMAAWLPSDRHSTLLNTTRLLRSYLLSAELPFDERYRRYVEVFSPQSSEDLLTDGPAQRFDALERAFEESASEDSLQQLLGVDLRTQLPDDLLLLTDKMSMANSLECRVPLLDKELVELGAQIPAKLRIRRGELKYIFKKSLADILPDSILNRSKRGFGAPVGAWMKRQLNPFMRALLSERSVRNRGLFHWERVKETMDAHETNREDHTDHLSALMNLEIWCRLFLDKQSHEDIVAQWSSGDGSGDSLRLPSLSVST